MLQFRLCVQYCMQCCFVWLAQNKFYQSAKPKVLVAMKTEVECIIFSKMLWSYSNKNYNGSYLFRHPQTHLLKSRDSVRVQLERVETWTPNFLQSQMITSTTWKGQGLHWRRACHDDPCSVRREGSRQTKKTVSHHMPGWSSSATQSTILVMALLLVRRSQKQVPVALQEGLAHPLQCFVMNYPMS